MSEIIMNETQFKQAIAEKVKRSLITTYLPIFH